MPRSARKESGCGIYHVMMRGINRQAIFDDDEDCHRFMDILADLPFQHDDDGRLLPISHVRAVLKRISMEDLTALVNEPCDANCVDVDNTRRLQDSEVKEYIIEQCGAKSVAEFQRLTKDEQTRVVRETRAEGASIRQVMSHTGWSYRKVREAK